MGRYGQVAAGRRACVRRGRRRAGTHLRRQGRLLAAPGARGRRAGRRDRPDPAGAGRDAAGADRAVAVLRRGTRRGDRALDGRGDRRGGGRCADPCRGARRDRHPDPADEALVGSGRDGAAGAGRDGSRAPHRRPPRRHGGGVRLAEAVGDRGPARAGRRAGGDGGCAGQAGPPHRGGRGLAPPDDRPGAAGAARRPVLPGPGGAEDPAGVHGGVRRFGAAVQRRLLGGQPAQPGAVQPGGARRRRRQQQFHRDQPTPVADARHQRHLECPADEPRVPRRCDRQPRPPRGAGVPFAAGRGAAPGDRGSGRDRGPGGRRAADGVAARAVLDGGPLGRAGVLRRAPVARVARGAAGRQRPRLAVRCGPGRASLAGRPHRAQPARHAGRRLRRDRVGCRLRGTGPARHRGRGRDRSRADAAARRSHQADHADRRRRGRRPARRDPLAVRCGHLDPTRGRQGPAGSRTGRTRQADGHGGGGHAGLAIGLLHRPAPHRCPSRPRIRGADPHRARLWDRGDRDRVA